MRIFLTSPNYPSKENKHAFGFVHARAKIYVKNNHNVMVFVPSDMPTKYTYEHIPVLRAPLDMINETINEYDPDTVAVHAPHPQCLETLGETNRPFITFFHGWEVLMHAFHNYIAPFGFKSNIKKVKSILLNVYRNLKIRRSLIRSTAVVYPSEWMRKMTELYLMMRHPRSFVVPNPVDTELFRPLNDDKSNLLLEGISVRSLKWKYGLDIAIRAFSNLDVKLTIVGRGYLEEYLKVLVKNCISNVKIITEGIEHEKLPMLYSRYGFFVAPSRTEGQGVAMCEAMACGLPVVAAKVGGIPEFIKNRVNGLLVPPEDYVKLREAIKLLTSDSHLYDSLCVNGREYIVKNLSETVIYKKEFTIFKSAQNYFCDKSILKK